jgi:hypothetical protein
MDVIVIVLDRVHARVQIYVEALVALVACAVGSSWWAGNFKRIHAAPTLWPRYVNKRWMREQMRRIRCVWSSLCMPARTILAIAWDRPAARSLTYASFADCIHPSLSLLFLLLGSSRYDDGSSLDEFALFVHRGQAFAQWKIHDDSPVAAAAAAKKNAARKVTATKQPAQGTKTE